MYTPFYIGFSLQYGPICQFTSFSSRLKTEFCLLSIERDVGYMKGEICSSWNANYQLGKPFPQKPRKYCLPELKHFDDFTFRVLAFEMMMQIVVPSDC